MPSYSYSPGRVMLRMSAPRRGAPPRTSPPAPCAGETPSTGERRSARLAAALARLTHPLSARSFLVAALSLALLSLLAAPMVAQAQTEHVVPADWSLKPDAVGAGEAFRLMFFTSATRNGEPDDIADYNTFVQTAAAAGHTAIQSYSADFLAFVSTETVNIRANTDTESTDTDVPIYWLGTSATRGALADDYADLYDGTWAIRFGKDENGSGKNVINAETAAWFGSETDGTTDDLFAMGQTSIGARTFYLASSLSLARGSARHSDTRTIAAISPIFRVAMDTTATVPGPPKNLMATAGDGEVTLSWEAPDSTGGAAITGYQHRHSAGTTVTSTTAWTDAGAVKGVTVTSLTNGTEYAFEVRAVNSAGEGAAATATATPNTTATVPVPGPPTNLAATAGDGEVTLSWEAPDGDITGYQHRHSEGTTVISTAAWTDAGAVKEVTVTSLTNGTGYAFEVRAVNSAGAGAAATATATPVAATVCTIDTSGRTEIWTGTVTVGEIMLAGQTTSDGFHGSIGGLSDPKTFQRGTNMYTIDRAFVERATVFGTVAEKLVVRLDTALTSDDRAALRLHVCGETFDLADSDEVTGSFSTYSWDDTGLDWSSATTVNLALSEGVAVNLPPVFDDDDGSGTNTTSRSVAENTASGQNIGTAVGATDADNDALTYSLSNTDSASFDFDTSTGQLKTKAGVTYDFETKQSYTLLTVSVSDGNGGTADIPLIVHVTDVNEKSDTPSAPMVGATANSHTSLDVSWTEPGLNGGPSISGYHLRYRQGTSGTWTNGPQNVGGTSSAIASLDEGTAYEVQVRALNGETPSDWSASGSATTSTNTAPVITTTSPQSVAENTTAVATLAATDADAGDTLTWSTNGGADAGKFALTTAGVLTFATAPNFESPTDSDTDNGYVVTVRVSDGTATADLSLTVNVTNVSEQPDRPDAPSVTATSGSTTSLDVSWTKPGLNGGPEITGYNLEYRTTGTNTWDSEPHTGIGTMATIDNLSSDTEYRVRVRALNGETPSDWSSAVGSTNSPGNTAPVITTTSPQSVAENTTAVATLAATDAEGDDLAWSKNGGADAGKFDVTDAGVLAFATAPDFDSPTDAGADNGYEVTVRVSDGTATADLSLTVNVTNVIEKPDTPAAPSVGATMGSNTSLDVSWTEPGLNGGPPISGYNLRYRQGMSGDWTYDARNVSGRSATIGSLAANTLYEVQVRAINDDTSSDWSASGSATTSSASNTVPGAPTGLTATKNGATAIDLAWTAPADNGGSVITGYKIEVSSNGGTSWTDRVANTNSTTTTYAHTGLSAGTTRHYRVSAINSVGTGAASNVDNATTANDTNKGPLVLTVEAVEETVTEGEPVRYRILMSRRTSGAVVQSSFSYKGDFVRNPNSLVVGGVSSHGGKLYWEIGYETLDDAIEEKDGSFTVTIQRPESFMHNGKLVDQYARGEAYTVGSPSSATVTIIG